MADYYPLLTRALDALSDQSPPTRRAVYDRARQALMDQLRSLDPPLSEADIARERLALEEAVNRVEAEHKRAEARGEPAMPVASARPEIARRHSAPHPAAPPSMADEAPSPERAAPEQPVRERPRVETAAPRVATSGRGRTIILAAALAAAIGAIAVAAWYLRDKPADLPRRPVVAEAPPQPEPDSKIADRVAGDRVPTAPAAPAAPAQPPAAQAPASPQRGDLPVAQRAMLYEENQADPQTPKVTQARAVWRLDNVNAGQGQPLETAVRALVEVPDARITLNMLIRRNTDQTLPASHTIELSFTTPPEPNRTVRDVGLLQFKNDETVRGTPVAGLPVPVKENIFLIGLSNLPSDIERNTELMTKRNWIDLPIRFSSGQRAILSFEKGVSGEQVMNEAFRQWGAGP